MSRGDHIKLLNELDPEPVHPQFPRTNIQFTPVGFAVQVWFADDILFAKVFDAQAEAHLCDMLIERRKQARLQAELVRNIEKSKLH